MAHTRANAPPTAMPTRRNGSKSSHTTGYSTSARSASGQHNTNRINQTRKVIIRLIRITQNLRHGSQEFGSHPPAGLSEMWPWIERSSAAVVRLGRVRRLPQTRCPSTGASVPGLTAQSETAHASCAAWDGRAPQCNWLDRRNGKQENRAAAARLLRDRVRDRGRLEPGRE